MDFKKKKYNLRKYEPWKQKSKEELEQERLVRINVLARLYEQADRVLSGDKIVIQVEDKGQVAARSDGVNIFLNSELIKSIDLETLTNLTGLNYHELAHHLYSPRKGTPLVKTVLDKGWVVAFDALEDQRIDTLIVGRYRSIAPFLTGMITRWLGAGDSPLHYISMRGRRYLPVELREAYRDIFPMPELIPVISEIVDEYRLLAFPTGYARALELIERYHNEVIVPLGLQDPYDPRHAGTCLSREPIVKGRPEKGEAQVKDSKRAQGIGTPEASWSPKPKQEEPQPGKKQKGQGDEGEGDSEGEGEGEGEGDSEGDSLGSGISDSHKDITPESIAAAMALRERGTQTQRSGWSLDYTKSQGGVPKNVKDMVERISKGVLLDKAVLQDAKAKQQVIIGGDGKHKEGIPQGRYTDTPLPHTAIVAARRFTKELEKLRDDTEPTWERETSSGRLNVPRVIRGCELDQAFDRWEDGTDGTDIEAVLLVDRSGSMSSGQNDVKASIACWVLKLSLEAVNAFTTVYSFDGEAELVYSRNEKVSKSSYKFIYGSGGTDPNSALLEAEKLLISSRKKNKMLFVITDGDFYGAENDKIISRIGKRGVLTSMVLISGQSVSKNREDRVKMEKTYRHGALLFGEVAGAEDLFPFAKSVVTESIQRRR